MSRNKKQRRPEQGGDVPAESPKLPAFHDTQLSAEAAQRLVDLDADDGHPVYRGCDLPALPGDTAARLLDEALPVVHEQVTTPPPEPPDAAPAPRRPVLGDRVVVFRAVDLPAHACPLGVVNGMRDRLAVEYPGARWLVEVIQYRHRGPRPDWEADGPALELILRHWEREGRVRRLPDGRAVFSLRPHD